MKLNDISFELELLEKRRLLTMPEFGSTKRERVSTATTWLDWVFHAQYLRQFAIETLSQG